MAPQWLKIFKYIVIFFFNLTIEIFNLVNWCYSVLDYQKDCIKGETSLSLGMNFRFYLYRFRDYKIG